MLSTELLAKIKKIQFQAGHLVTEALAGGYTSAFKGKGMEFDEVREYTPGDDVRAIDWNVTARMEQPFIKIYKEERELSVMLLIDASSSQDFGSGERTKREICAEFAAIMAFLATRNSDRIGVIVFSDQVELFIPPKKGRGHVWRVIQEIMTHQAQGKKTDIATALRFMASVLNRRSLCFLISDFRDEGYQSALASVRSKHDLVCVDVSDPREHHWPDIGLCHFVDAESNRQVVINTSDRKTSGLYEKLLQSNSQSFEGFLRSHKIDSIELSSDADVVREIEVFFRRRGKRRRI